MRHTVVISDVHLWDALPGDDLWMRYRQRRFFPDEELARLFDVLCAEAAPGALELVFNGDLFDFDIAPVVEGRLRFGPTPYEEGPAAARLEKILDDHPVFLDAVARVLAAGHWVVFVSGNHDAQLTFPRVRDVLRARLSRAIIAAGRDPGEVLTRVLFRAWFHRTADGIHVEHGNQYDHYCSFLQPMEPFARDGAVQPTTGSLVMQHIIGRLGYMNPNVDSTFLLSPAGYLAHWLRYYALSCHSLAFTWAFGALRVALGALRHRQGALDAARLARCCAACAAETGASPAALAEHAALFAPATVHEVRGCCASIAPPWWRWG
jgi:hypothetical protein